MHEDEGLNRIVASGVLYAIKAEIDRCIIRQETSVDNAAAAIRMIINAYDQYFQTGRL